MLEFQQLRILPETSKARPLSADHARIGNRVFQYGTVVLAGFQRAPGSRRRFSITPKSPRAADDAAPSPPSLKIVLAFLLPALFVLWNIIGAVRALKQMSLESDFAARYGTGGGTVRIFLRSHRAVRNLGSSWSLSEKPTLRKSSAPSGNHFVRKLDTSRRCRTLCGLSGKSAIFGQQNVAADFPTLSA